MNYRWRFLFRSCSNFVGGRRRDLEDPHKQSRTNSLVDRREGRHEGSILAIFGRRGGGGSYRSPGDESSHKSINDGSPKLCRIRRQADDQDTTTVDYVYNRQSYLAAILYTNATRAICAKVTKLPKFFIITYCYLLLNFVDRISSSCDVKILFQTITIGGSKVVIRFQYYFPHIPQMDDLLNYLPFLITNGKFKGYFIQKNL